MKTLIANIPARSQVSKMTGKKFTWAARSDVFTQNDDGKWFLGNEALTESEVIDVCRKASNWSQIKAAHFSMADINKTDSWI